MKKATASAAKAMRNKMTDAAIKQEKEIDQLVTKAAVGDDHIFFYESLLPGVRASLEKRGFQVKEQHDRDGLLITISWK